MGRYHEQRWVVPIAWMLLICPLGLLLWLESRPAGAVLTSIGAAVFLAGTIAALVCVVTLFRRGEGLGISGLYRHVRNPLVMAWSAQLAGIGLFFGSPWALAYVPAGMLFWNFVTRPGVEAELEQRFGDAYRLYRRRVRCWRPRLDGYDPARDAEEPPLAAEQTTPPGKYMVLYDGYCRFCTQQSKRLTALARPGAVEAVNFQEPAVLERFPGLSHEACMQAMYLVMPDGRVYRGFEAAVRALASRRVLGWLAYAYYLPGIRLGCDLLYELIAKYRYHIMGKAVAAGGCDGGTCSLHARPGHKKARP